MLEPVTVDDFIQDTIKDINFPSESEFSTKISAIRQTVHSLDEGLESDRSLLFKSKKFVKAVVSSGIGYADSIVYLCDHLENLGQYALEPVDGNGSDLTAGLCQFSVIHRDLANMFKHLMQNLNSILVFPMETFLQGDLKSDLKKPFDKAHKEYECKYDKLRKEKIQAMKESGVFTPETFPGEMSKKLEKERRRLQLEVCEYFLKVNDVKAKRGADFLQHFVDFYHAHLSSLKESVEVMEHFGKKMPDLANRIGLMQKQHDTQKRRLIDTRENVRKLLDVEPPKKPRTIPYNPVQASCAGFPISQAITTNLSFGTQKTGFLHKKSDGKVKRLWQRRRVCIGAGMFTLFHADETKAPVKLMLLTCQLKLPQGQTLNSSTTITEASSSISATSTTELADHQPETSASSAASAVIKRSFFLVSNNRTYQFQAEDERDFEEWTNVLSNAMQAVFNEAMNGVGVRGNGIAASITNSPSQHSRGSSFTGSEADTLDPNSVAMPSLTRSLTAGSTDSALKLSAGQLHAEIQRIMRRNVAGNNICADCGRQDPEWVSVNLGVLICLECCGTHRELGVQYSRTQSLLMDDLSSSQLLLPRFIGNRLFNEIYESSQCESVKPTTVSDSASRRNFIRAKYLERKFITSATRNTSFGSVMPRHRLTRSGNSSCCSPYTAAVTDDPISLERLVRRDLFQALRTADLQALIQVHAEGFDLTSPFSKIDNPDVSVDGNTPVHILIENCASLPPNQFLPFLCFIIHNSPASNLQRPNSQGDTPLHYAAQHISSDAIRLLMPLGSNPTPMISALNHNNQTPLDIVRLKHEAASFCSTASSSASLIQCEYLLQLAEECQNLMTSCAGSTASKAFSATPGSFLAEQVVRQRFLDSIDDLETVQWGVDGLEQVSADASAVSIATSLIKRSNSVQEDSLARAIGETLAESPKTANREERKSVHPCRTNLSFNLRSTEQSNLTSFTPSYAKALATLPRKKGPAPKPPAENSWFSIPSANNSSTPLTRRLSGGTSALLSRTSRHHANTLANPVHSVSTIDHIDVLLDVLEEHPQFSGPPSPTTDQVNPDTTVNHQSAGEIEELGDSPIKQQKVVALYDCDAENPDELTFKRGETIIVLKNVEQDWWEGYVETAPGRCGLFPLPYVKLLQ